LPPRAIAKERNLYVVESAPDGLSKDEIERFFASHVEEPFIAVRNHLAFGDRVGLTGRLTEDDRVALAYFIAFQQVRTPAFRERLELMLSFMGATMAHSLFSNPREIEQYNREIGRSRIGHDEAAEFLRALEVEDIVIKPGENQWLRHSMELAVKLMPIILNLPSKICRTTALQIPTSDSPLVIVRRQSTENYFHGGGWTQPELEATISLSPNVVLAMGGALTKYHDHGTTGWFHQVRHRIATGAHRWLYSSSDDDELATWLYASKTPEMVVRYPGGVHRSGESVMAAILDMKRKNPGEATIMYGPESL
jgi:hypothetical protein